MKKWIGFVLLAGLVTFGVFQSLWACQGHEVRAADTIADILDDLSDSPGVSVQVEDYTDPNTGLASKKTTLQVGDTQVQIFPYGDHNLRVVVQTWNGDQETWVDLETRNYGGGEWDMVPNVANYLKNLFNQPESEEDVEEYAG